MKLDVTVIGDVPMQPRTLVSRDVLLSNIDTVKGPLAYACAALSVLDRTLASVQMIHMRLMRLLWPDLEDLDVDGMAVVAVQAAAALKLAARDCRVVEELCSRVAGAHDAVLMVDWVKPRPSQTQT